MVDNNVPSSLVYIISMKRLIAMMTVLFGLLISCKPYGTHTMTNLEWKDGLVTGEIRLPEGADIQSYSDCEIVTTAEIAGLQSNTFKVQISENDAVQPIFLMDENDNVYLMARTLSAGKGVLILDERSTALAMATLHPLLAPLKGEDYTKIVRTLETSDSFEPFVKEVAEAIVLKRNLFDPDNESLLLAFNNLLESVAKEVDEDMDYSESLDDIVDIETGTLTRAIYESPKIYPLHAEINGSVLTLRNVGLTPSYYGSVYEASGSVTPFSVPSRSDYGGMDLFKENLDEFMLGDPRSFVFTTEGNYKFNLSRTNDAAKADFWLRLANAMLTSLGLSLGNDVIQEVGNMISRAMINANSGVSDVLTDPMEWVGIAYGAVAQWAASDYWEAVGKGGVVKLGNVLVGSLNFYNKIKGVFNASMRLAHMLSAPESINFCLCYRGAGDVLPCSFSTLYVLDGDNQHGYAGQRLLLPISVYVETVDEDGFEVGTNDYNKVKFEVVSGGGHLDETLVSADHNNLASTYWTLGREGTQTVKAVAVDFVTGAEISEPVYFNASLESAQITIRLDWSKHSCDTDIDLHVIDPFGEKIFFDHMASASGGYLDRDDTVGPGPEHIRWSDAPEGVYKIYVHYYPNEAQDQSITSYTVSVTAGDVTYAPKSGSIAYNQYVPVGQFRIGDNTTTRSVLHMESVEAMECPNVPRK